MVEVPVTSRRQYFVGAPTMQPQPAINTGALPLTL